VGRGAEDDVVGRALRAEAAVLPRDVHPAGGIDLSARKRAGAQVAVDTVEADVVHRHALGPRRSAGTGRERLDLPVQALEGDDDRAVRLYDGLSAETLVVPRGVDGGAPGESTVV